MYRIEQTRSSRAHDKFAKQKDRLKAAFCIRDLDATSYKPGHGGSANHIHPSSVREPSGR
jgi:hypothetical protein